MKYLKTFVVCALLATSGQSFAQNVPVKFAKGSHCGAYEGKVIGKQFTLGLGAGQSLTIQNSDGGIDTIDRIIVRDAKGALPETSDDSWEWNTRMKGQHTITIVPYKGGSNFASVNICAY